MDYDDEVKWLEQARSAKDEVKRSEGPPIKSQAPERLLDI